MIHVDSEFLKVVHLVQDQRDKCKVLLHFEIFSKMSKHPVAHRVVRAAKTNCSLSAKSPDVQGSFT